MFVCGLTEKHVVSYDLNFVQKGPMDILSQTIRNEGFFALYKGKEK
jgi:hypothetical protein